MFVLTRTQRHYLLFGQLAPAVVINFVINFVLGWWFFHHTPQVSLMQSLAAGILPSSIAMDLLPTTFFLIFFTSLIVTHQVLRQVREGRVSGLPGGDPLAWFGRPQTLTASFRLAAFITLTLVPITVFAFHWHAIEQLPLWHFIWFKAIYATVLAALFTPVAVIRALAQGQG